MEKPRRQNHYTVEQRREALERVAVDGCKPTARALNIPLGTLKGWRKKAKLLFEFKGAQTSRTTKGQGAKSKIAFERDLVTFMKDVRREEEYLCTGVTIEYMKMEQGAWLEIYLSNKSSPESALSALMRLCQRFAARHGFSVQKPQYTKKDEEALQEVHVQFAIDFWKEHGSYPESAIYNVDETAIYFDTHPHKIWAIKGRRGSAKVKHTQKNSGRLTAVLTIRADGKKLPILFILRGMPGGTVETDELPTYPPGHVYTVQENGWMDATVWQMYVRSLLKYEIDAPSVLLLDNFDSHVSKSGQNIVAEETSAIVCPVPANSTSVSQPLDVGVMGPLKKKLSAEWLREKVSKTRTVKQKRLGSVMRTIRAWEDISTECVVKSFEKAIPKEPEVMV